MGSDATRAEGGGPRTGREDGVTRRVGPDARHGLLWTCPRCGLRFVSRNLQHSCGRATLAEWKRKMGPRAKALYHRFEELISRCGPFDVSPAKTRITFLARVRFAGITRLSEGGMTCNFALPYPVEVRQLAKVTEAVPGWWVHELRVTEPAELDARLQGWLRRSYRLMGMQGRLRRRPRRRTRRNGGQRRDAVGRDEADVAALGRNDPHGSRSPS
jgi:hypothetical protein